MLSYNSIEDGDRLLAWDRAVKIAGITTRPDEAWMLQVGRNLTDWQAGALYAKQYLIIDRDTKYSGQFRRLIRDAGTNVIPYCSKTHPDMLGPT